MITFGSEVGPDVMMFDEIAERMMVLMGKDKTARGVVTVEQMPDVIARLKAAAARDKAAPRTASELADAGDEADRPVGLSQRIAPLVELLEISLARGKPVTWGV